MERRLNTLNVLVYDCQASHPDPQKGHLLEAAWGVLSNYKIGEPFFKTSAGALVKPEQEIDLPRQVSRVTGITVDDLQSGIPAGEMWEQLQKASNQVAKLGGLERCPTIIHYSRYEEPYLKFQHEAFSPDSSYPFDVICTHKISQRLWPDLPRRGLRALAGFLGYSVGEFRRSTHHIEATAWIWRQIVEILMAENGIETLESLKQWLQAKPAGKSRERSYPMAKEKRKNLPQKPGVYQMFRSNGDILYVGKATSLRQRVNSYFQKRSPHAEHKLEMLSQAVDLSVIETPTALEAALLESDLIKKLSPPYNIALKTGNRQMVFSNHSYDSFSPLASSEHIMGPFPSPAPVRAISSMADLLSETNARDIDPAVCETVLNIPAEFSPGSGCFLQGLDCFQEKYKGLLSGQVTIADLLGLAIVLHQEKLDLAVEEEVVIDDADEDIEAETEWEWTPEIVCSHLEGVLSHGAHLIRRSKWFCQLSESVLTWAKKDADKSQFRMIIMEKGAVQKRAETGEIRSILTPPGSGKSLSQRKQDLDLIAYDRLRVLTTEIRRLVTENRELYLRLTSNRVMDNNKLDRCLMWL